MKVRMTLRLLQDSAGKGIAAFTLDEASKAFAKEAGWKLGESYDFEPSSSREHGSMKYAHLIGKMLREQVAGFEHLDPHEAIKKLQTDSGIHCEVTVSDVPGLGRMEFRKAKSLGYDTVKTEERFTAIVKSLIEYIATAIWPTMTTEEIEVHAGLFK